MNHTRRRQPQTGLGCWSWRPISRYSQYHLSIFSHVINRQ